VFLQELWLPSHVASIKFESEFSNYNFISSSVDSFTNAEDILENTGPTWHGTALAWHSSMSKYVKLLPLTSTRHCGIMITKENLNILAYTAYLPTSGQDSQFLEEISLLAHDIQAHGSTSSLIIMEWMLMSQRSQQIEE